MGQPLHKREEEGLGQGLGAEERGWFFWARTARKSFQNCGIVISLQIARVWEGVHEGGWARD